MTPAWNWDNPFCDPLSANCDYGLEQSPITGTDSQPLTDQDTDTIDYEDCSDSRFDEDCIEYWSIQCVAKDAQCLISSVDDSCADTDYNCQVNFLRAFCEKYDEAICDSSAFKKGLSKVNGCLPGEWQCVGF